MLSSNSFLICTVLIVSCHMCFCDNEENLARFEEFKKTHNKVYDTPEENEYRFKVFVENMKAASERQKRELGTAKFGVTKFSDLTVEEFRKKYLGLNMELGNDVEPLPMAEIPDINIPKNFDWRKHNAVTPVKNQEDCGSCWAFSLTGNIESVWAVKNKKLISLSEQELIDCNKFGEGCIGGLMRREYSTVMERGGLESEKSYPYTAKDGTCVFNKTKVAVTIRGAVNISSNEEDMAKWLYKNGAISIAINAFDMRMYEKGISHPSKADCDPKDLNHGVSIVGYGVEESVPYWIIKNSWGPTWGEQGYYRVRRGMGICGLNTEVSSAVL